MRKKSRKRERGEKDEGEEMMERQLRGEKRVAGQEQPQEEEKSGTRIIRPDSKGKGKEVLPVQSGETNGHVNFWADLEAGVRPPRVLSRAVSALADLDSLPRVNLPPSCKPSCNAQ